MLFSPACYPECYHKTSGGKCTQIRSLVIINRLRGKYELEKKMNLYF